VAFAVQIKAPAPCYAERCALQGRCATPAVGRDLLSSCASSVSKPLPEEQLFGAALRAFLGLVTPQTGICPVTENYSSGPGACSGNSLAPFRASRGALERPGGATRWGGRFFGSQGDPFGRDEHL